MLSEVHHSIPHFFGDYLSALSFLPPDTNRDICVPPLMLATSHDNLVDPVPHSSEFFTFFSFLYCPLPYPSLKHCTSKDTGQDLRCHYALSTDCHNKWWLSPLLSNSICCFFPIAAVQDLLASTWRVTRTF